MAERTLAVMTKEGLFGYISFDGETITYSNSEVESFANGILRMLPSDMAIEERFEHLIGTDGYINSTEIIDGAWENPLVDEPAPKDDPAIRDFEFPSVEEILGMKGEILGGMDPAWRKRYGDASWEVALALLGIIPTNVDKDGNVIPPRQD